ncbi:MAG: pilus assembly protein TadG-related protein [Erythrobacter sp.]
MGWLGKFWSNESGASAALYALALPALVGMVGIGFDYARIASMDTELQNAADQAALAGATQLDQLSGAISRATTAARNGSTGLVNNTTVFANDGNASGTTVAFSDVNTGVFFYENLVDAEAATNPIDPTDSDADSRARFIRVKADTRTANYALTPVIGAFKGSISAEAVAGIGSAVCRIPPLMMCNPDEPENNENEDFDFNPTAHIGQGLLVVQQGFWGPGAFGFLDLGTGAVGVQRALAWTSITGECVPVDGPEVIDAEIEPGLKASTQDAINTRFDMYDTCPDGGTCPASINSIKDVTHLSDTAGVPDFTGGKSCTFGQNGETDGWDEPDMPYLPDDDLALPDTETPSPMGHPRDICHSLDTRTCGRFGDGFWDRDAYFRSRYGWTPAQWQANTGLSIGTGARPSTPTRFDVYKWEIKNKGNTYNGATVLENLIEGSRTNYARPVCSPHKAYGAGYDPVYNPDPEVVDRRRMSVAVINCEAENVGGKREPYRIRKFVDVFLVQPSLKRDRTAKTDIYVEIIGESDAAGAGEVAGTVIRRDVPYLVK